MALIVKGHPVEDTDNVISLLDDRDLSWHPGDWGTDKHEPITQIVGHWTAAEHEPEKVVLNMKRRKGRNGRPLRVAIPFLIGKPTERGKMAPIYQSADPVLTRSVHVGTRVVNRQSIGVEIVNAADPDLSWAKPDERGLIKVTQLGREREWTNFYPEQIEAWIWLCDTLTGVLGIDRNTFQGDRRMSIAELRKYRGVLEHWNVSGTRKLDAGGILTDSLADEGYKVIL